MTCRPAAWPLWPCEVRAGDWVARTPRMHHDSNREGSQMEKPHVFLVFFSFFTPLCACFMGAGILNPPGNLSWLTLLGISTCFFLEWMPRLRLWKKLSSLRVFSGYWVTQSCLLAMAGCPVIYQTDCGKADWKLTVDSLADLFCVSWWRGQLLPKRRQQES